MQKDIIKAIGPYKDEINCLHIISDDEFNITYSNPCTIGNDYTLSLYIKSLNGTSGKITLYDITYDVSEEWDRKCFKFNATEEDIVFCVEQGEYLICMGQLESGSLISDWSPNPDDIYDSIKAVDNKFVNYSTTEQMNSAIEQKADSITSTVSKTYATQATVDANLTTAKGYADTAQSNAISAAASDATTKANNALASAKSDTDTKLESYSTTEQMNSAISQSADNITSTVSKTYATKTSVDGKVDESTIISAINQTAESIKIAASKLELTGAVTFGCFDSNAQELINGISSDAESALSIANSCDTTLASWCHDNDKTYIDGSKIYTGTITADKLNVNDLSAVAAKIAGWSIGTSPLSSIGTAIYNSSDSYTIGLQCITGDLNLCLFVKDADNNDVFFIRNNGEIISKYNNNKISIWNGIMKSQGDTSGVEIANGSLAILRNSSLMSIFFSTRWKGTSIFGTTIRTGKDSKYIDFSNINENNEAETTKFLLNYGLNPDGYTEDILMFGKTRFCNDIIYRSGSNDMKLNDMISFKTVKIDNVGTTGVNVIKINSFLPKSGYARILASVKFGNATNNGANSSQCFVYNHSFNSDSLSLYLRTLSASAKVKITITVMYVRSEYVGAESSTSNYTVS